MTGFFKYKHGLLLKGVYSKNSSGNKAQLHLNNSFFENESPGYISKLV